MSRTISKIIVSTVNTLMLPLSKRQGRRTIARIINGLGQDSLSEIHTKNGDIKLFALKSPYVASAVERFHTDEPETIAFIDEIKEGEILWDIGANIGIYSLYAALKPNINILAFEPSGFNFGLLVEHIALNQQDSKIKPFCIALGEHTELSALNMSNIEQGHAGNALGEARNQFDEYEPYFTQAILSFSIDCFIEQFQLQRPDHIKLDVDGIEPMILSGAKRTLSSVKTILIEVEGENEENAETLIEVPLSNAGFREDVSARNSGSGRNRLYRKYQ